MADPLDSDEELVATITNAAGIILAVTENRNWIEVFFEGDTMHTKTVNLPDGIMFNIYIEEIPHKTTRPAQSNAKNRAEPIFQIRLALATRRSPFGCKRNPCLAD
jgi:hypothetical protein